MYIMNVIQYIGVNQTLLFEVTVQALVGVKLMKLIRDKQRVIDYKKSRMSALIIGNAC